MSPDQLQRRRLMQALGSAVALSSIAGCKLAPDDEPRRRQHRAKSRKRFASTAVASKSKNNQLVSLLDQIEPARLTASVAALAEFGTRWSYSPQLQKAEQWIHDAFADSGYPAGNIQSLRFNLTPKKSAANVVCFPDKTDEPFLLVCAHYDSISEDPQNDAPGADDNASAVAVMLEVARLMRGAFPTRPVMYAAFAGEEQYLDGSSALACRAKTDQWPIDVLINLDMVGWVDPAKPSTVIVELDEGWISPGNDAASKFYGMRMAQAVIDYALLDVEHANISSSDYLPFEVIGVPCIGIWDGADGDQEFYHSRKDVPTIVNEQRLVQVTKALLAFVADFTPWHP